MKFTYEVFGIHSAFVEVLKDFLLCHFTSHHHDDLVEIVVIILQIAGFSYGSNPTRDTEFLRRILCISRNIDYIRSLFAPAELANVGNWKFILGAVMPEEL